MGINSCHPLVVTRFTDGKTEDANLPEAPQPEEQLEPSRPHGPEGGPAVLTAPRVGGASLRGSATGGSSSDDAGESVTTSYLLW